MEPFPNKTVNIFPKDIKENSVFEASGQSSDIGVIIGALKREKKPTTKECPITISKALLFSLGPYE